MIAHLVLKYTLARYWGRDCHDIVKPKFCPTSFLPTATVQTLFSYIVGTSDLNEISYIVGNLYGAKSHPVFQNSKDTLDKTMLVSSNGEPGNKGLDVASLVARPFPPPVFDRLQDAKLEEEGLGKSHA